MPIRLSGLASGMDTEAIVGALMSAQSLKKTKITNQKTKLEWTQTKWQDLNTKLYKLYTDKISKMQLTSSYKTKKATVSDPTKANVTASASAVNGNYTMEIKNVATTEYLTSAKLSNIKNTNQKLSEISSDLVNSEINITVGGKTTKFTITADTKISDFTKALSKAGLNASFDTTQQRFFISSKNSGMDNAFSITSQKISKDQLDATAALKDAVGYNSMTSANKAIVDKALTTLKTAAPESEVYKNTLDSLINAVKGEAATVAYKAQVYAESYDKNYEEAEKSQLANFYEVDEDGNAVLGENGEKTVKESLVEKYTAQYNNLTDEQKAAYSEELGINFDTEDEEEIAANLKTFAEAMAEKDYKAAVEKRADADTKSQVNAAVSSEEGKKAIAELASGDSIISEEKLEGITNAVNAYATLDARYDTYTDYEKDSVLSKMGLAEIAVNENGKMMVNGEIVNDKTTLGSGMAFIAASDSEIVLNGATLTSSTSTISVNGLSIELTGKTEGESITFSVSNDVDAVYNAIKDTLTAYNEIMKEMYSLYNAEGAKGYEPLTSEEKEHMSEDDIKLYEDKIKSALLKGDNTLDSIMSAMRNAMQSQVSYNGKNYALSSFGIMTSFDFTEGGALHIYGDTDDSVYGDYADKLKTALAQDPDKVVNVLSGIFSNLKNVMSDKMAGTKLSSALTFYNDIKMKDDLKNYEKDIKTWEDKLAAMEDSYYKKFTAMEKALAQLQSQQGSLASLFGQ